MEVHYLKAHREPFQAMWEDLKTAEFRKNDRNFKVDDILFIREINEEYLHFGQDLYTGRVITAAVTHVLKESFGVPPGYAMLSLKIIRKIIGDACTY